MISELTFIPWLVGAATILLLLWLTWRRPNRKRLPWRMVASAIAGVSLVLLVFPPTFEQTIDAGSAILLTEGYETDTLTALLQKSKAAPLVYRYQTEASEAEPVANLYTLLQEQPQLQTIYLVGNGLAPQELVALKSVNLIPHIPARPAGIADLFWPATTQLGDAVAIAGQYNAPLGEVTSLYLSAAGKVQDSVQFKEDGLSPFQLNFTPKQEGRFVYQVITKAEGRTDTLGQVPVQVLPTQNLGVLLLSAAPLFEFNFLKNHLGKLQHRVALRSAVSKGITRSEWINMPQTNLGRITPNLLEKFDLVITEPQALQNLSQAERTALQQAVIQAGLGVLTIRGEQQPARATAFFTGFSTKRASQQDTRTTTASWGNRVKAEATAIPYTLVNERAQIGLIEEESNGLLAAAKKEGWGTVAVSLIPQTFSWQLEGKENVYASYWAYLLSELAKKKEQEKFWQVTSPQAAKPGSPVSLVYTDYTINSATKEVPEAFVRRVPDTAGTKMALQQHPHLPEQFTSTFWPQNPGWHAIESPDAPPFYFFVQDSADWKYEAVQSKRNATRKFAVQQGFSVSTKKLLTTREKIPLFWFFLLFIISSGFLWLEEKL